MPTSASSALQAPRGHGLGRLGADHRPLGHAEQVELDLAVVGRRSSPGTTCWPPTSRPAGTPTRPPVSDSATPSVRPRSSSRSATTRSIDWSSTPKTSVAQDGPQLGLLGVEHGRGLGLASAALAVMRTLSPSMPEARKAMVGFDRASSASHPAGHQLAQGRLGQAPGAQHPAEDHRGGPGPALQVGDDGPLHHLLHLVRARRARRRSPSLAHRADQARAPSPAPGG